MPPETPSPRVFLADDSGEIRRRVADLLATQSIPVVGEAETPHECIEAILASRPDVVVLDIQLRGGTGLQVLQAVRAASPGTAFVVFSNNTAAPYRKRYLQAGAHCMLDKSTESDRLAAAIADASRRAA